MTLHKMIRRQLNSNAGFHGMIFFSIILHTFILSIILFLPSIPSPKLTFGPIYSVQLVSSSEALLERPTSAFHGISQDRMISDHSVVIKKRSETFSSVPIKKIEVQKRDFSAVEKAMDKIRQKVIMGGQTQVKSDDQLGEADVDAKMKMYYSSLWIRIKKQWVLPQSILPRDNIEAIVHTRILRNGAVTELGFEKKSGNRYFDESALKAVRKATPFPPLPEWVKDNSIEIGIRFHSSEWR